MELVRQFSKTKVDDTTTFVFPCNRYVNSVVVYLDGDFKSYKDSELTVKYGQNGITTDLIPFGSQKVGDDERIEVLLDTPVSASHIYVTLDSQIEIKDIEIYEYMSEEVTNYYPYHFDTDLEENYFLDEISVFTSDEGFSHYSVYTSLDGRDFELLAVKRDEKPCDFAVGDKYAANGKEARIIRVFVEYNTASLEALFDRVEIKGVKSNTPIKEREAINVPSFDDSEYNVSISAEDTYNELYGIIERRVGAAYKEWFAFQLTDAELDYFEITNNKSKIKITGNSGVSIAVGLNHYLKYYCKVNISQVGDSVVMPEKIVPVDAPVHKETKTKVRYAYNYCTLSYSMAFWGEKEWRDELDWLALNGVNVVLDLTAQEEVWRRFLTSLGYTHEEILKFIAGPAYYAWAYMANLSGFGGPLHDSWFAERTELARKNHLAMRKLGMYPCLQGYCGMVPNDIHEHIEDADVILQGTWCSFDRPTMLRTTAPIFKEFSEKFYKAQKEVFGDYTKFFATDPFHEGGNLSDLSAKDVSHLVLEEMLKTREDAVWIIQSWQNNPSSELLAGLDLVENGKKHALVLDLYAEKYTNYTNGHKDNPDHGYSPEFDSTPWVYCMLNNFGGRLGLHGHIDNMATWIPKALNTAKYMAGIGITPEASFNNPVLYDFFFETVWVKDANDEVQDIDLDAWIFDYIERRYGTVTASSVEAWRILLNTVYKAELNQLGQGAPESIVNARPTLESRSASSWGNHIISYDKVLLKMVARLLLGDYEAYKDSEGYKYDLVTVLEQILSNTAQDVHLKMVAAYNDKDVDAFKAISLEFLKIADLMDEVSGMCQYYRLDRWVNQARTLAENADEFTRMLYEMNAKMLISTWGSYKQSEVGGLHDYSNRQWSGLISGFYKKRWELWINERIKELEGKHYTEKIDWFYYEWNWVREKFTTDQAKDTDLLNLANKIL